MSGSAFNPKVIAALGAVLVILFAASLLLTGAGEHQNNGPAVAPNTYSRSATGHLGLFEVLGKLGYHVERGERDLTAMTGEDGVLVLAEPNGFRHPRAHAVLLVLPKRYVWADPLRDDWVGSERLQHPSAVAFHLRFYTRWAQVIRVAKASAFKKSLKIPDPTITGPLQLVKDFTMTPLVSTKEGILLGEIWQGDNPVYVLTDPDVIENHGLGKGDNIGFDLAMFDAILGGKHGPIVFDETTHGLTRSEPNPLHFLFMFPFNLFAVQVALGAALLLYAAMGRFGPPAAPERVLNLGKRDLIANAASLIDHADHHAAILKRYVKVAVEDTARQLHAPRQLDDASLVRWLDKIGAARSVKPSCRELTEHAAEIKHNDLMALLSEARAVYRWRKDILNGIPGRSGDH